MVCCSLTHDGEQLLDAGAGLEAYAASGATIGIPLLYPWANRLDRAQFAVAGKSVTLPDDRARIPRDPSGQPIHGVVPGLMRWLAHQRSDEAALTARLEWSSPELLELFPYAHEAEIEVLAGAGTLTIATTVWASAGDSVPVSFGFTPTAAARKHP